MCVIWPIYFDANVSRKLRRVPRSLAVPNPRLEELCIAVRKLGLKYEVVEGAAHPSRHWEETGYIFVEKKEPKEKLLRRVALVLKSLRSSGGKA
ncbi:signal recognition particle protein Srp19 [Candidatus Bathyarchaeota archaeon]|nr:MAG: signal recognition particle protein Srp19 [Candidatus Bathyarchaeota archaeon]